MASGRPSTDTGSPPRPASTDGASARRAAACRVVVLATGGTIAGEADEATDNLGYASARRGVEDLIAAVPALAGFDLEARQVAQVDSKDMTHALWSRLAREAAAHLARDEVGGLVVTHGTDTLEETAWMLHRVLARVLRAKPLVLTAAMRPATSLQADGPQNLLDAVTVARAPGAAGVVLAMGGQVWAGAEVRKVHPWRLDAFHAGEAGPVALVREGEVRSLRPWPLDPQADAPIPDELPEREEDWPWVEIVSGHAGASGRALRALLRSRQDATATRALRPERAEPAWHADGLRGIVVATPGNGSVHVALEEALEEAHALGVAVMRATRCADGAIEEPAGRERSTWMASAGMLTPAQARVELMLRILRRDAAARTLSPDPRPAPSSGADPGT